MKKIIFGMIFLSTILTGCNLGSNPDLEPFKKISLEDLHRLEEKYSNLKIIDVRTADEYNEAHIPNAYNKDWYSDSFLSSVNNSFSKNDPIVVYCRSGNRSGQAMNALKQDGFTLVYDFGAFSNYK